ncbi:DVUA0089 family protein [Oscillatoria sp. FACHB-1406]|uniref:DVUA0089 family protein n=1 Tax=Oscillatoria sp. FACHB-1406 TaxID=2692846 RepID=UPI0018EFA1A5|nr:DVUA0089 family protein [Oscillatoria sp. FACHB-1406]
MPTKTFKKLALTAAGTALLSLGVGEVARAATIANGTIFDDDAGNVTVDYWNLQVNTAGAIEIDALSFGVLKGDSLILTGKSSLDTYLRLYEFDAKGSLGLLGNFVAENDDSNGVADGSIFGEDSFLSVNLGLGNYVLAISDFLFSDSEARRGVNNDWDWEAFDGTFGKYQLTFKGDVTVTRQTSVPEPTSVVGLAAMGALGAGSILKRKKKGNADNNI